MEFLSKQSKPDQYLKRWLEKKTKPKNSPFPTHEKIKKMDLLNQVLFEIKFELK